MLGRAAKGVLLTGAIVVPVYFFVAARTAKPPDRYRPPAIELASLPPVRFPTFERAVPVLAYRDISDRPGERTVRLREFDVQLGMLKRAGFHTIGIAQLTGFLSKAAPLPPKPLLLTFDGTLGSAWRIADPVL